MLSRTDIQRAPSSFLFLQLIVLALSLSLSLSRLNDPNTTTTIPRYHLLDHSNSNSNSEQHEHHRQQQQPKSPPTAPLTVSSTIPSIRVTIELSHLSALVYYFHHPYHAHDCTAFSDLLEWYSSQHDTFRTDEVGVTYDCHLYERDKEDTQVAVLSRTTNTTELTETEGAEEEEDRLEDYTAVVYAGTDDFKNALTDAHIRTARFGPRDAAANRTAPYPPPPPDDVRVHAGFNNAVFGSGLMDRVQRAVEGATAVTGDGGGGGTKIYTTGHSLGGADAVLCAVALAARLGDREAVVTSVSIGCPKTGNRAWRDYVNSNPNVGVWRVVNKLDLVPRMPGFRFKHVGHTIQLGHKNTRAYWLHEGDSNLGYRGVPFNWGASSYFLAPIAAYDHLIGQYMTYLIQKSLSDKDRYYVDGFERIGGGGGGGTDEMIVVNKGHEIGSEHRPGTMDDDVEGRKIAKECAEHYLELLTRDEAAGTGGGGYTIEGHSIERAGNEDITTVTIL